MPIRIEERGPEGYTYRAVMPADADAMTSCGTAFAVVDRPQPNAVIAALEPASAPAGADLASWLAEQRDAGRGIVLQLPPAPPGFPPPLEMFCAPQPDFAMTVAAYATDSLNEARSIAAATPDSVVLRDPRGGWLELRQGLGAISWRSLAVAGVAVAVVGYFALRRR